MAGTHLKALEEVAKEEAMAEAAARASAMDQHAALKIQSSIRGRTARKETAELSAERRRYARSLIEEEEEARRLIAGQEVRLR